MSCESSWNRKQVPLLQPYNASPAVFNWKDGSVSLLPCPRLENEFDMTQDLHSQNYQILKSESSTMQCSFSVTRPSPGTESRMTQWPYPLANQLFVNRSNIAQSSNLVQHQVYSNETSIVKAFHPPSDRMLVNKSNACVYLQNHQLSSERTHLVQDFPPVTHQLSADESSISQQPFSLSHQLPTNGIGTSRNSNMFNHQLSISGSQIKYPPIHALSQKDFTINQVKYPLDRRPSERESFMRQGLHSIFGRHSEDRFGVLQNQCIPSHQSATNQGSYPSSVNFPEMGFDRHHEPSVSDTSLHQNLYPQYFERVHICVVGPPRCGKADLIRTFARNDDIRILTDKPLSWVVQQGMVSFGTTLKIDTWYGEDLTSAAEDIKSLSQSSKSVLVLLYSVAQKSTLLTVLEWIEFLKKDISFKVPIILIGNVTDVEFSCTSKEFPEMTPNIVRFKDGAIAKDKYGLAAFYECSTKSVKDVEAIFLTAALKAFHQTRKSDKKNGKFLGFF